MVGALMVSSVWLRYKEVRIWCACLNSVTMVLLGYAVSGEDFASDN